MPIYGWVLLAAYVAGYVRFWRTATWVLAADFQMGDPGGEAWAYGIVMSTVLSMFWPLVYPFRVLYVRGKIKRLARPPRAERLRAKEHELREREAEVARREQRLDKKERELGIGPYHKDVRGIEPSVFSQNPPGS